MNPANSREAGAGNLAVCNDEPIMRFLLRLHLTPLSIGLLFLGLLSLPLAILATLSESPEIGAHGGFWENISWSVSILLLFPIVVGLVAKYYMEIPRLFAELSAKAEDLPEFGRKDFIHSISRPFDIPALTLVFAAITLSFNCVYYLQILEKEAFSSWITNGHILQGALGTKSGFTPAGLFSAAVQILLSYWIMIFAWKSIVLARNLILFFDKFNLDENLRPLHEDHCCGLKRIGDVAMICNIVLFLLGLYVSLKVIDKTVMQNLPITNDIGNPICLAAYTVLAPVIFFSLIAAPHKTMQRVKRKFLSPLVEQYSQGVDRARLGVASSVELDHLEKLDALIRRTDRQIQVWPFNFRSIKSFVGTVIVPLLPILLPLLAKAIAEFIRWIS